jgi:hypothetical protein
MLDPNEEKKGGFGAFAQRDRARREAEALRNATPKSETPSPPAALPTNDLTSHSDATPGARTRPNGDNG